MKQGKATGPDNVLVETTTGPDNILVETIATREKQGTEAKKLLSTIFGSEKISENLTKSVVEFSLNPQEQQIVRCIEQ